MIKKEKGLRVVFVSIALLIMLMVSVVTAYAASGLESSVTESRAEEIYQGAEDKLDALYKNAVARAKGEQESSFSVAGPATWAVEQFYIIYRAVKESAVVIGAVSILFGAIMARIVRRNKKWSRNIVLTFVIGLPVLLILFCFGVGALIG